jgi:hypothetical protein
MMIDIIIKNKMSIVFKERLSNIPLDKILILTTHQLNISHVHYIDPNNV